MYRILLERGAERDLRRLSAEMHGRVIAAIQADFGSAQPGVSAHAFGSDWARLEAGTCGGRNLRFRDPLNKERRFIPLRLDEAPIKGSLAEFLYTNWRQAGRGREYGKFHGTACEMAETN